ncbi:hypothetical protein TcasGA2_TC013512 [Tribolium castaneum]|uniref:Uncharacterized protein n=1 Tax=Tribolium castaneum TaxID=7070 RepID=D6WL47_TRICA|nr:hypothetical protein TcasGA2_TC013512 [Tribolium castaneum]
MRESIKFLRNRRSGINAGDVSGINCPGAASTLTINYLRNPVFTRGGGRGKSNLVSFSRREINEDNSRGGRNESRSELDTLQAEISLEMCLEMAP